MLQRKVGFAAAALLLTLAGTVSALQAQGVPWIHVEVIDSGWDVLGNYDVAVASDGAATFIGPWGSPATFAPGESGSTHPTTAGLSR